MFKTHRFNVARSLGFFLLIILSETVTTTTVQAQTHAVRAVVQASSIDRLRTFHRVFLQTVNAASDAELEDKNNIGCVECGILQTASSLPQLTYIFWREHTYHYQEIGKAWAKLLADQTLPFDPLYKVTFDTGPIPSPTCTTLPMPCTDNPVCSRLSYCSKNTSSCVKCQ